MAQVREVVAEAALAHSVRNKVEAANRRANYLRERRSLMETWATFLALLTRVHERAATGACTIGNQMAELMGLSMSLTKKSFMLSAPR